MEKIQVIELFNLIQEAEKYEIEVFVSYSPHVNLLHVTIFDIKFDEVRDFNKSYFNSRIYLKGKLSDNKDKKLIELFDKLDELIQIKKDGYYVL